MDGSGDLNLSCELIRIGKQKTYCTLYYAVYNLNGKIRGNNLIGILEDDDRFKACSTPIWELKPQNIGKITIYWS